MRSRLRGKLGTSTVLVTCADSPGFIEASKLAGVIAAPACVAAIAPTTAQSTRHRRRSRIPADPTRGSVTESRCGGWAGGVALRLRRRRSILLRQLCGFEG